jgi:hypothetical protein
MDVQDKSFVAQIVLETHTFVPVTRQITLSNHLNQHEKHPK